MNPKMSGRFCGPGSRRPCGRRKSRVSLLLLASFALLALLQPAAAQVGPSYTLLPAELPAGRLGQPYAASLIADCPVTFLGRPPAADGSRSRISQGRDAACAPGFLMEAWIVEGMLPPGLSLSLVNGNEIRFTGTPAALGGFSFRLRVTDSNEVERDFSRSIQVVDRVEILTPSPLPSVPTGSSVSVRFAAVGGKPPYCWRVISGLPPGVNQSPCSDEITGVPREKGNYRIHVLVEDGVPECCGGPPAEKDFDWTIADPLSILTTELRNASLGNPYLQRLLASGGQPPYLWGVAAGNLPLGLALDPTSGDLFGSPLQKGSYSFTVRVVDQTGRGTARAFTIQVTDPVVQVVTAELAPAFRGVPYQQWFEATGGLPPYSWRVLSGRLPSGLSLTSAGLLAGIPSETGSFDFVLEASAGVDAGARAFRLTVREPELTIATSALPQGVLGRTYAAQLAAAGGVPPYSWRIQEGRLPAGIRFSAGRLSGAPEESGQFPVVFQLADARGDTASRPLTLTIAPSLNITTSELEQGVKSYFYRQELSAAGGVAPYAWSVSGELPQGLIHQQGVLLGTPEAQGEFPLRLQVTDSEGYTAERELTLVIAGPLEILTSALPPASFTSAYSQRIEARGGKPPYQWALAGALPAGLQFDAGVLSGSPTQAGTFHFTISVTDQAGAAKSRAYTITVQPPELAAVSLSGPPAQAPPASQHTVRMSLAEPYPVELTGTLQLSFAPDQGPDDPAIRFSSGTRSISFRIPAGTTDAVFDTGLAQFQTGTTAGVITLRASFRAAGIDVTPTPAPEQQVRIAPSAPVIVALRASRGAATVTVTITGYSTPRNLSAATFTFTAASGVALQGGTAVVPLATLFAGWYAGAESAAYGTQFELTVPFTVSGGDASGLTGIAVTLTNSVGTSTSATIQF